MAQHYSSFHSRQHKSKGADNKSFLLAISVPVILGLLLITLLVTAIGKVTTLLSSNQGSYVDAAGAVRGGGGSSHHEYSPLALLTSSEQQEQRVIATQTDSNIIPIHESTHGLDCRTFLRDFRHGLIPEMAQNPNYGKPYVTKTINPRPFYWSTHHPDIDKTRQSSYYKGNYYETQLSQRIIDIFEDKMKQGKEEAIMLDVGGNIGWFSLLAAAHGATKVYTFEPNPANLIRFCESLQLNDWLRDDPRQDLVVPMPKGVSNEVGIQTLYRADQENPGAFTFSKERFLNTVKKRIPEKELGKYIVGEIELDTLDHFAETMGWFESKPDITFFKLDVEGLEPQIVYGGKRFFQARLVEYFAFETKPKRMSSKDKYDMLNIIYNSGYDLYMHGGYKGPYHLITKTYNDYKDLAADICKGQYGHNLLFRRREDWSMTS
jgi:FkbM family methyltransferase